MSRSSLRSRARVVVALCAAAALGVAVSVLSATAGAAAPSTPDAVLLSTYQPVLVFHPDELFRPVKVQSFVDDAMLERFVGTSAAQLPYDAYWTVVDGDPEPGSLPQPTSGVLYRLNQSACDADATLAGRDCYAAAASRGSGGAAIYGRVVRTDTRTVLQYWLFYYDNPQVLPQTPVGYFWQSHEGDWELVNVILDANEQPIQAAYSQHCSGQRTAWENVARRPAGSTHPVVYVALGSHANYFAPGTGQLGAIPISPACVPAAVQPILPSIPFLQVVDQVLDGSSVGSLVGPPGSGLPQATIHRIEGTEWSTFGGRWGESEYFYTPIALGPVPAGATAVGLAPASPANQAAWNVATILAWPMTA